MAHSLYDPSTDNQEIHPDSQQMINQPLAGGQIDPADQELLDKIKALVEDGTIQTYVPSSLVNQAVYDQLAPEKQGFVDQKAMNMLSKIRQLLDFHNLDADTGYQEKNLLHSLRLDKEHVEEELGDVFVI